MASKSVTIVAVTHDLLRQRSIVTLVWDDDPEKRIALPVSFGCDLSKVKSEAEKAMRDFAAEAQALTVK